MADYVGMKYSREWYEEQALEFLNTQIPLTLSVKDKATLALKKAEVYAILATIAPTMEDRSENG